MPEVISNSSPLIYLAKIERLNLLSCFFDGVTVPEAVYRECVVEGEDRKDAKRIKMAEWISVEKIRNKELKKAFMMILDEGEAETIVLALEKSADLLLLDEYEARKVARTYKLSITGTIGILLKAMYEGKIPTLKNELDNLRSTGFWLHEDLYKKILRKVDEL